MKKIVLLLSILFIATLGFAQEVESISDLDPDDKGVVYALPKTVLEIKLEISHTYKKAGPYFRYAQRLLNATDVITEDSETYSISKVKIYTIGVADSSKTYVVEGCKSFLGNYITTNSKGIIKGINIPFETAALDKKDNCSNKKCNKKKDPNFDLSAYSEEQLTASTTAKMAETAAKEIFRLREARLDLITGTNEKVPEDGESLKKMLSELDKAEAALMELFVGKTTVIKTKETIEYTPKATVKNEVIARISSITGLVDSKDLSGAPIYISITAKKSELESVSEKTKGIYYNLPGSALVKVTNGEDELYNDEITIAQFGTVQALPLKLFRCGAKTKVYFCPKTGAVKSIIK